MTQIASYMVTISKGVIYANSEKEGFNLKQTKASGAVLDILVNTEKYCVMHQICMLYVYK